MEIKYDVYLATGSGILYHRQVISDRDPRFFIDGYFQGTYDPKKGIDHDALTVNFSNGPLVSVPGLANERTPHWNNVSYSIRRVPRLMGDFDGIVIGRERIYDRDTALQMAAFLAKIDEREGRRPVIIGSGGDYDGDVGFQERNRTLTSRCRIWSKPKQEKVYGPVNHSSFKRDPYRR